MPATYEPISSFTLGSAATEVTFSSIPSTFTDLVVVARFEYNFDSQALMRLNGSTSAIYSTTQVIGAGSLVAARTSGTTQWQLEYTATDYTNQTIITVHINNYANTNMFKSGICLTGVSGTGSSGGEASRFTMLWQNTAAINSVTVGRSGSGQYIAGSTFALYGIKAA